MKFSLNHSYHNSKGDNMEMKYQEYAPTIIRIMMGLLMFVPGLSKLMNPSGIIGMLGGLGFPAAAFFGWLLLLSEIAFGAAVIVGWKLEYTVWPLVLILAVATITVHIPNLSEPMGMINVMWHLLGISVLISLFLSGPGALSVQKN